MTFSSTYLPVTDLATLVASYVVGYGDGPADGYASWRYGYVARWLGRWRASLPLLFGFSSCSPQLPVAAI